MKAIDWVLLPRSAVYYAVQSGSNYWVCGWKSEMRPIAKCSTVYYAIYGGSTFA